MTIPTPIGALGSGPQATTAKKTCEVHPGATTAKKTCAVHSGATTAKNDVLISYLVRPFLMNSWPISPAMT